MNFSIVTPSFRNSRWLKLCIASVADQQGVEFEHIVQDSCSDDGTQNWLPQDKRVKAFIEKDTGMYDAVNRGYRRAQGDILAYLNCDEQYLPGALRAVGDYFAAHPEVEVAARRHDCRGWQRPIHVPPAFAGAAPAGGWFRFSELTPLYFIRRKVIHERGIYFRHPLAGGQRPAMPSGRWRDDAGQWCRRRGALFTCLAEPAITSGWCPSQPCRTGA